MQSFASSVWEVSTARQFAEFIADSLQSGYEAVLETANIHHDHMLPARVE